MSLTQEANGNFISLREDPISLLNLVNKHVKIDILKNNTFTGFVHSIDPITHSVILLEPLGDTFKPILISGDAIVNINEVPSLSDKKPTRKQAKEMDSVEGSAAKKSALIAWFKTNLLPVKEVDDKIVLHNVEVLPPYNVSDVCTDNPIVALQIKKIMESMPKNISSVM